MSSNAATVICDTHLPLGRKTLLGALPSQTSLSFPTAIPVNCLLIQSNNENLLFDAGIGRPLGQGLQTAMDRMKIGTEDIDAVFISHMHCDHAGGLLENGMPRFPRATVWVCAAETDFWSDEESIARLSASVEPILGPDYFFEHMQMAQRVLSAYAGRIRRFSGDGALTSRVAAIAAPGHTPGHTCFALETTSRPLLYCGDIVHLPTVQLPNLAISTVFDHDPELARRSRELILEYARIHAATMYGAHGIGPL